MLVGKKFSWGPCNAQGFNCRAKFAMADLPPFRQFIQKHFKPRQFYTLQFKIVPSIEFLWDTLQVEQKGVLTHLFGYFKARICGDTSA